MQETLKKILKEKLNLNIHQLEIRKLFGHASSRIYYRIFLLPPPVKREGPEEGEKTFVLMQLPPGASSVSEEITNDQGPQNELPFINIQRTLASLQLPVPHVYAWVPEENWIILEDVGDRHLESYLKENPEALQISFYKKAIDLLVEMQKRTKEGDVKNCIAFHRSFDAHLLNWEFDHFLEYGIEDRFKLKVSAEEKIFFQEITRNITREITQAPYCFVHRDFQSRNLMMKDYELYLLDFQDALQGPEPYDLVSLTRDSYIELRRQGVDQLICYYLEKRKQAGFPVKDESKFRRLFDLVTLQRKLKDTGRFQFIHTVKGNPHFLVSVPTSLRYIQEAFGHLPEFQPLQQWMGKYIPEVL